MKNDQCNLFAVYPIICYKFYILTCSINGSSSSNVWYGNAKVYS